MSETGGDLTAYVRHFNFVAQQAASHHFMDIAFVAYDRYVVDQVIKGMNSSHVHPLHHPPTFVAGDLLGVASSFHAGNLVPSKPQFVRGRGRGFNRRGSRFTFGDRDQDRDKEQQSTPAVMPEGFPEDVCFSWNYRTCTGKCSKSHVCRLCRGAHKAMHCPSPRK